MRILLLIVAFLIPTVSLGQTRHPIPKAEDVVAAQALLNEAFAEDVKNLKSNEGQYEFVRKMLAQANPSDDPLSAYVMLLAGLKTAGEITDVPLVQEAAAALAKTYEFNAAKEVAGVWLQSLKKQRSPDICARISIDALARIDDAMSASDYTVAKLLAQVAADAARRSRDVDLIRQTSERQKSVMSESTEFAAVEAAQQKLAIDKDDQAARVTIGKYLGFRKKNWPEAFVHLAAGNDPVLKSLAEKSVANPSDPIEQLNIADAWFNAAQRSTTKPLLESAASYWYAQALPGLRGLARTKAEGRVGTSVATVTKPVAPPAVTVATPSLQFDLVNENQVAVEIVKVGGSIQIATAKGRFTVPKKYADLPILESVPPEPLTITRVSLDGITVLTPEFIQLLGNLKNVDSYILSKSNVKDSDLQHLHAPNLVISSTGITDGGLQSLRGRKFSRLFLSKTMITDEGLEHLLAISVKTISVSGTQVTPAGLARFRQLRPECEILD